MFSPPISDLANLINTNRLKSNTHKQYIVAIAGCPGCGKTLLASKLVAQFAAMDVRAVELPMDGYHLWRHQLDAMDDPREAYKRRGAPWTFDGEGYLEMVQKLRKTGNVVAPGWDHAVKDPTDGMHKVCNEDEIVLLEGNYLLLEEEPWQHLRSQYLVDFCVMVKCDVDVAMKRVAKRAVDAGIEPNEKEAWRRVHENDQPNAHYIYEKSTRDCFIVQSL